MAKPSRRSPEMLKAMTEMASKGLNKTQICRDLNMSRTVWKHKDASDAYEQGRNILAKEVASAVQANLLTSFADRNLIAQKLRIYSSEISVPEIKDVTSAKTALGIVLKTFLNNEISSADVEVVRKTCSSFIDAEIAVSLAVEVDTLKKLLMQKGIL